MPSPADPHFPQHKLLDPSLHGAFFLSNIRASIFIRVVSQSMQLYTLEGDRLRWIRTAVKLATLALRGAPRDRYTSLVVFHGKKLR